MSSLSSSSKSRSRVHSIGAGLLAFFLGSAVRAQTVKPRTIAVFPHDSTAFTQGLVLFEGKFFESTGLNGQSTLRRVTVTTGVIEKNVALDSSLFGEGLARVDRQLIQLTYKTGAAIVYDLDTFAEQKRFTYTGEGWGLCFDGTDLVMSNGSNKLTFRDPATFAVRREITVQENGTTFDQLNELECVGSLVYANVWKTNTILRLDKATGNVLTQIDAAGLLTADETMAADVLNGIAYDEATQHFYLTGKYWPKVFEVTFDFDPDGDGDAGIADASAPDANGPRDAANGDGFAPDTIRPGDARADNVEISVRDAERVPDAVRPPDVAIVADVAIVDGPSTKPDVANPPAGDASTDVGSTLPPSDGASSKCACRLSAGFSASSIAAGRGVVVLAALYSIRRYGRRRRRGLRFGDEL